MERFRQVTLYEECERAKTEYEKAKQVYDLYCSLVKKAEPKKGLLTNTILEYVLNPFCGHVNEFLKQLVFDCIENLDASNIDALMTLLLKPEIMDRYDHVILSVVDHKSIVETIDKYRYAINVIDF